MKVRNCPNCGYHYSFFHYLRKYLFRMAGSSWHCAHCGSPLTFNAKRRLWLMMIAILPIAASPFITELFQRAGLSKGISWLTFIPVYVSWSLLVVSFDTFILTPKEEKIND